MKYSAEYKHAVLQHYKEKTRGSGFLALAKRFDIKGGKEVVRGWFARWNGRVESLGRRTGSGRPQILTQSELKDAVRKQRPKGADELAGVMEQTFMALEKRDIKPHFQHCALTTRSDLRKGLD